MASLVLDHVSKVYRSRGKAPVTPVDKVDLTVNDGEIVGALGLLGLRQDQHACG